MKDEEKDRWIQEVIEEAILKACLVRDKGYIRVEKVGTEYEIF